MRTTLLHSLLVMLLILVLITGCENRARLSADYTLVQPGTYLIDSGSPPCALYFKGHKAWRSVLFGTGETCHDGIFVFMSTVPDSEGECTAYPEIFAIRGAGPPVVLSERILNQPFKAGNRDVAGSTYEVESLTPITNGVRVIFNVGVANNGSDILVTNDLLWPQIETWMQEAQTTARLEKAPLGNYRVLPMQRSNTVLKPARTAP